MAVAWWFHFGRFFGIGAVPGLHGRLKALGPAYLPELTGLRGIAILTVVGGHLLERVERFGGSGVSLSVFNLGGLMVVVSPFLGCCIFFGLSGYSLMNFLRLRRDPRDASEWARYSKRRIIRLYPPYCILLLLTFLFLVTTRYMPEGTRQFLVEPFSLLDSLLASLTFTHHLLYGTFPRLFPPGWFLEVQVQFYIVAPLIWLSYLRIAHTVLRLWVGLAMLAAFLGFSWTTNAFGAGRFGYSIISFMPYFWVGAVLADLGRTERLNGALRRIPGAGWIALAALVFLDVSGENEFLKLAWRIACLAAVLCAATVGGTSFQQLLTNRWLIRLGVASYSIYLVHVQILQIVTPMVLGTLGGTPLGPVLFLCGVTGIVAVLVVSLCFYWLVERPFVAATRPA